MKIVLKNSPTLVFAIPHFATIFGSILPSCSSQIIYCNKDSNLHFSSQIPVTILLPFVKMAKSCLQWNILFCIPPLKHLLFQSLPLFLPSTCQTYVGPSHLPHGMSAEGRSSIVLPCGYSTEKQTPSKAIFLDNEVDSFHCISLFNEQSHANVSDVTILWKVALTKLRSATMQNNNNCIILGTTSPPPSDADILLARYTLLWVGW